MPFKAAGELSNKEEEAERGGGQADSLGGGGGEVGVPSLVVCKIYDRTYYTDVTMENILQPF